MTQRQSSPVAGAWSRRAFLVATGSLLAGGVGCSGDAAASATDIAEGDGEDVDDFDPVFTVDDVPEDPTYAPLPLIVGAPEPTRVRVTCFVEEARRVAWRVWRDGDLLSETKAFISDVVDDYAEALATGLLPNTEYYVAMFVGEGRLAGQGRSPTGPPVARSRVGRFRTPPADDASPTLRFALVSATFEDASPALDAIAADSRAASVHVGGLVTTAGAKSLADVRAAWREQLGHSSLGALFTGSLTLTVPSASEVAGIAPLEDQKRLYSEALPATPAPSGALWGRHRWGKTAEVFLLDTATESESGLVSTEQLTWLASALAESPCRWKLVVTAAPAVEALMDALPAAAWAHHPDQRTAFLDALSASPDVIVLTRGVGFGSVHRLGALGPWEISVPPAAVDAWAGPGPAPDALWTGSGVGAAWLTLDAEKATVQLITSDGALGPEIPLTSS
ncbi:MAG: hypothetical protein IV100_28430 [Myxococcales bacterium]|nr:hypothetical protein [Myxococcales bacterium]